MDRIVLLRTLKDK